MKTKRAVKTPILLATIAIVFLAIAIGGTTIFSRAEANAETAFSIECVRDECERLTRSDKLEGAAPLSNGKMPTIQTYMESVNKHDYEIKAEYMGLHLEHLFRIIPQELFRNTGNWFYNGYDYSFFVKTWEPLAGAENYISEVVIIDNFYEFDEETSQISVQVNLFSKLYFTYCNGKGEITNVKPSGDTYVKYYLSDVQFFTLIANEHEMNFGDEGYSKYNDNGTIIRQTRLNYKGIYNRYVSFNPVDLIEKAVDIGLGYIPIVKDVYNTYKDLSKPIKQVESWINAAENGITDNTVTVVNNNEANISNYPTRQAQLESEDFSFTRYASVKPKEAGLMVDEYAQMITMLEGDAAVRSAAGVAYHLYVHDLYHDYIVLESGEYKQVEEDKLLSEESSVYYPLTYNTYDDLFFDEHISVAEEGENDGYLLSSDSEQIFEFIPNRNGDYTVDAGIYNSVAISSKVPNFNQSDYVSSIITEMDYGEKYYISVIETNSEAINRFYKLVIDFTPKDIEDMNNVEVAGRQDEYFNFVPNKSGIYSLNFASAYPNTYMRIDHVRNNSIESIAIAPRVIEAYLTENERYFIIISNVGTESQNITLNFGVGQAISDDLLSDIVNITRIYTFTPEHNGEYTFSYQASSIVDFSLQDDNFYKLYNSNIGTSGAYTYYYRAGQTYYIAVNAYLENTAIECNVEFTPPETSGKSIVVDNLYDYNIIKFSPQVSGKYLLTIANAENVNPLVYNQAGVDVTAQKLSAGETYYIVVRGVADGMGKLEISLDCDRLQNNTEYTVKSGRNTVAFIAPVSGSYSFVGLSKYTVFSDDYKALYNQSSNKISFEADTTYYVEFDSSNASSKISVYFDPVDLPTSGNIVFNNSSYYEIIVTSTTQYSLKTKTFAGKNIVLRLYDSDLELINTAENALNVSLEAGRYYLQVETDNIDTMLSIINNKDLSSSSPKVYSEGTKISTPITAGNYVVYTFNYNKKETQTRYYLKTNEQLGENVDVSMYYFDAENRLQSITLTKMGEVGNYRCNLVKSISNYYIVIQSEHYKVFEMDLYVPAHIEDILINGVSIYMYINSLYLGVGETYNFSVVCNSNATYGAKMRVVTGNVTCTGNSVTLPNELSLLNSFVELAFETLDDNDYRMYLFEITHPYVVSSYISNDVMYVLFKDLYSNTISQTGCTQIEYYYNLDGKRYSLGYSGQSMDLASIPNIDALYIYADIYYDNGTKDKVQCYYSEKTYGITENVNLTGKKRLLIDAKNSGTTIDITLKIPTNITTVNIRGSANKVFNSYAISIDSRSTALTINLYDFNFTAKNSRAIYMLGTGRLYLNIYGTSSTIRTTYWGANAIEVPNLTINGKTASSSTFYVYGGNNYTYYSAKTAGTAIKVTTNLTVNACKLYAYGGKGELNNSYSYSGYHGAHGGIAVQTNTLTITGGSKAYLYGGNGSYGLTGATGASRSKAANGINGSGYTISAAHGKDGETGGHGGNGGNGGNGGLALSVTSVSGCSTENLFLFGGNGGSGGAGGNGGRGGEGGNGAPTRDRKDDNDAGTGGRGGNGGNGGDGGKFGLGGNACNLSSISATITLGICGIGGRGGNGGEGGAGGKGGDDTQWIGAEASGGDGGDGGNGGNGYFNVGGVAGGGGYGGMKGDDGGNVDRGVHDGKIGDRGTPGQVSGSLAIQVTNGKGVYIEICTPTSSSLTFYTDGNSGDPYLELFDLSGNRVAYDDDSSGLNSRLTYTTGRYTTYRLYARAYSSTANATYTLHAIQ